MKGLKLGLIWPLLILLALTGCRRGGGLLSGGLGPATPKPTPKPTSPGINKIAYLANDGSFWLISPDGKKRRLLFYNPELAGKTDLHFDWSPDASKIIMDGLRLIDLQTGEIKEFPKGETPKWSPKGDYILFTGVGFETKNLYLISADGSDSRLIDKNVILDWGINHGNNWSKDGRRFVYTKIVEDGFGVRRTEIWIGSVDRSQKLGRLFDQDKFGMFDLKYPTWSRRKDLISFTFRLKFDADLVETDNLAVAKSDGSEVRVLTRNSNPEQSVIFPTWVGDGRLIVWLRDSSNRKIGGLWKLSLKDEKQHQIFKNDPPLRVLLFPPDPFPNNKEFLIRLAGTGMPGSKIGKPPGLYRVFRNRGKADFIQNDVLVSKVSPKR